MVLRKERPPSETGNSSGNMSNEQPVSKRQRIENSDGTNDETGTTTIITTTTDDNAPPDILLTPSTSSSTILSNVNTFKEIDSRDELDKSIGSIRCSSVIEYPDLIKTINPIDNDMEKFQKYLLKQCLCGISERQLRKPFQSHYNHDQNGIKRIATLQEWPTTKLIQFLSNLQLLFDIYLKQNTKGKICARIMDVCDALIRNEHNLIDEIIELCDCDNKYVTFLSGRVLSSFLIIAKDNMNNNWLKKIVNNLFMFEHLDFLAVRKINFSLEIIRRIVEWKDIEIHPLDDDLMNTTTTTATTLSSTTSSSHSIIDTGGILTGTEQLSIILPPLESNYFATNFQSSSSSSSSGASCSGINRPGTSTSSIPNSSLSSQVPSSSSLHHPSSSSLHHPQHNHPHPHHNPSIPSTTNLTSTEYVTDCQIVTLTDSESFDTTHIKCETIKILENKWPALVKNISQLILSNNIIMLNQSENCILTFLSLWECIISVRANLSVIETLPFYAQLDKFELLLLNQNLSCTIYKQMLTLFNEALCYGSTLALQDLLPEETCSLAHQIVRHVKDFRILDSLPRNHPENPCSLIGYNGLSITYNDNLFEYCENNLNDNYTTIDMDKTLLQKMVLLVLKSVAVTVKEIRSDSSDSSIDSTDYDAFQDMILIERSIRDVLKKLEIFIKNTLEFHPESHFSKILIYLFDDQDDYLIEAMVCLLDVTAGITFRNNEFPELVTMLNPVYIFLEFLKMITNSSDLLLDLLVSNETCFLLYLLRFLKYIRINWSMFIQSCNESNISNNVLDDSMTVLIRLRLQISRLVSKSLYPYDIAPVLRLLESCENLYEGNELS